MENAKNRRCEVSEKQLKIIKDEIEKIQYGTVTVVVHEGKIVQVDTSTKLRLT